MYCAYKRIRFCFFDHINITQTLSLYKALKPRRKKEKEQNFFGIVNDAFLLLKQTSYVLIFRCEDSFLPPIYRLQK